MTIFRGFCFLLLFAWPVSGATYKAIMLPPSGTSGERPVLTCGFHGGSCGTGSGYYLDWDNTSSSSRVWFRGYFSKSSNAPTGSWLVGERVRISGGPGACDIQDVKIVERHGGMIRGVMRYLHITTSSTSDFSIQTSKSGKYNTKYIGDMIDDTGCGAFGGTHVHAGYTSEHHGSVSRSRNTSLYPSGDYCDPGGGTCRKYKNNDDDNWTHKFTWQSL